MGRTGGGGSRGGGFSHSSHSSSSRSHSSHHSGSSFSSRPSSSSRISSSSRPVGGGSYRPPMSGGGFGGHRPPPPPPPRPVVHHHHYGPSYGYSRSYSTRRGGGGGAIGAVVTIIIMLVILGAIFSVMSSPGNVPQNTRNRDRLSGGSFTSECVMDDIGWIRDDGSTTSKVGSSLKAFWDKTGVQPYVALVPYDSSVSTSSGRFDYADWLYETWIGGREDAMLAVYFDAKYDNEDGDWEIVCGRMAGSVMDSEAQDILYAYIDRYWFDLSYTVPQAIQNAFKDTGNSIMEKSTTGADVMVKVVGVIAVIAVVGGIILIMKTKRKHEAERAQETVDILQAGQNQQMYGSGGGTSQQSQTYTDPIDDLAAKYNDQ